MTKEEIIRDFLLKLKKEKLFTTFYLACSNAFGQFQSPKTRLNNYLESVIVSAYFYGNDDKVQEIIDNVKIWNNKIDKIYII